MTDTATLPMLNYAAWLEASISNYEKLARGLVAHNAEKGRVVEAIVKTALRAILPGRFSIGTGFAINAAGETSSQLDLVIYDAALNAPIILEGGTGLFPIECIYGLVEVKSTLDGAAIKQAMKSIRKVRLMSREKRYVQYGSEPDSVTGNPITTKSENQSRLPPRSYIFALSTKFAAIDAVVDCIRENYPENDAFVHGTVVVERKWLIRQVAERIPYEFVSREGDALAAFCGAVLDSLQSMPVKPASMGRYLGLSN